MLCGIEESRAKKMQAQMFVAQQIEKQKGATNPDSPEAKEFKQAMEDAAKNIK